jgi:hypothetical protein
MASVALLLLSTPASGQNWISVFQISHQGRDHFALVDTASIVREGNIITYWYMDKGGVHDDMANSRLASGEKVGYVQVQKRMDCGGMWELETLLRRRVDLDTGKVLHEWRLPAEYLEKSKKYYLPGTIGFSTARTICELDRQNATTPIPPISPTPPTQPIKREQPRLVI